ncbi:ribonuclease domain-containing protein [Micromonospora sp. WMMD980]|uniref:ribonuclease domain-containing protein n=1 Tax=Micromonospora sp. WMMD980 TaxID=3016088 RepID=UPI00241644B3|nr:ribonuclease domain-containing protein [Micromonospora sp. WMMD980]MDG4800452.1 ribonuclease domain-containing protein [Micromonospora sp. WMMD980]
MTPFRAAAIRVRRALAASALVTAVAAAALVAPATVSTRLAEPAEAAVHSSCTLSRCADARTARSGWSAKSFPTTRGWYSWSGGTCNFAGGQFYNREGQLPTNATYYEYDVYPRACNASRDAYRIVVNKSTGATWFSPDHYANFYRL